MAEHSTIEWTEASWNPIAGCSVHSPGCINCYAMKRVAPRLAKNPATPHYAGTVAPSKAGPVFTGVVNLASERVLTAPLRWKKPRMIFVNSTSDLFHENVPDEWIDRVFAVMALCWSSHSPSRLRRSTPLGHTFQVLTKRSERMRAYLSDPETPWRIQHLYGKVRRDGSLLPTWPLSNVWLGVSAERQKEADERVPDLLATPAAVRFVSAEPLLGSIDFTSICTGYYFIDALKGMKYHDAPPYDGAFEQCPKLDQMIVGGESGKDARPMHPDWARQIRDDCKEAGVPFFFKQWGEWAPGECANFAPTRTERVAELWNDDILAPRWNVGTLTPTASEEMHRDDAPDVYWLGKKRAGRLLDGVQHNGMPQTAEVPAL